MAEQETTDTQDTDNTDRRGPRERAYDRLIAPLMAQIILACEDNNIPAVCKFELDKDEERETFRTTILVSAEDTNRIKRAALAAYPRKAGVFAFTTTPAKPAQEG